MARRRSSVPAPFMGIEPLAEDTRPIGGVRFADPSTAEFPRHSRTFNDPPSNVSGQSTGIRSMTGDCVPWRDRHSPDEYSFMPPKEQKSNDLLTAMHKKRGVLREEE